MYSGIRLNRPDMNRAESKGIFCPNCGWSDFRVSQDLHFTDRLLSLFAFAPLRCRKCRRRFYRPWFMLNPSNEASFVRTRTLPRPRIAASIIETSILPLKHEAPLLAPPACPRVPHSVLLVDEDRAMRKLLAMLLTREGFTVHHAEHSDAAMDELAANRIDVVIANLKEDQRSRTIEKWRAAHPELPMDKVLMLPLLSRPRTVVQAVQTIVSASRP